MAHFKHWWTSAGGPALPWRSGGHPRVALGIPSIVRSVSELRRDRKVSAKKEGPPPIRLRPNKVKKSTTKINKKNQQKLPKIGKKLAKIAKSCKRRLKQAQINCLSNLERFPDSQVQKRRKN
jgi:hypothetical protein